jgi:hypothetical protein
MNIVGSTFLAISICASCDPRVPTSWNLAPEELSLAATLSGNADSTVEMSSIAEPARSDVTTKERTGTADIHPSATNAGLPEATAGVSVLIAVQKTALPRTTDTVENARKEGQETIARLVRLRDREDANFALRTVKLARRMKETNKFVNAAELATATSGEEFLQALITASGHGPIVNLVVYGHGAPNALYMLEDRGFYASVGAVAVKSALTSGTDAERTEALRALGARDLSDLESLIRSGDVAFASNAVIVFTGCAVAGHRQVEMASIAARLAELIGATVIASVGETDQSMTDQRSPWKLEGSRGSWMRFVKGAPPQKLSSRYIDALQQLRSDSVPAAVSAEPARREATPVIPASEVLQCASRDLADLREAQSCGLGARRGAMAALDAPAVAGPPSHRAARP